MTIAVSGSTGHLGRLVLRHLAARSPGQPVVALARDPAKAADLGVPVRAFDYEKPDTLAPALAGVRTLLLISSSEIGRRAAQHRAVIDAARAAGVGRIVYTSLLHADTSPLSLAPEHVETEAALRASGIAHTVLRNGWYAENHTGSLKGALAHGALIGSAGEGRFSAAARDDYAEAAAVALLDDATAGQTVELAGDHAWTLGELAAELSRQAGRAVPYRDLPPDDYAAALKGMGLPEVFARGLADWDADGSRGALFDDGRALSRLIGRPTATLPQVVAAALA